MENFPLAQNTETKRGKKDEFYFHQNKNLSMVVKTKWKKKMFPTKVRRIVKVFEMDRDDYCMSCLGYPSRLSVSFHCLWAILQLCKL